MPWATPLALARTGWRQYSSSIKPSIKLVGELRKRTDVSLSKAREALAATDNDIDAATVWLEKELAGSGAQKLAKLEGRPANEGVIAISILSPGLGESIGGCTRAAMVELNCETDFVSRNALLRRLAANIAHTAAFLAEPTMDQERPFRDYQIKDLSEAPLLEADQPEAASKANESVNDHIRNTVAKMGEKITLRRAVTVAREKLVPQTGFRIASYVHGALADDSKVGHVGTLVDISLESQNLSSLSREARFGTNLAMLERAVARQIVGLNPAHVRAPSSAERPPVDDEPLALYDQQFMMHPTMSAETVESALANWARQENVKNIQVNDFVKWKVGEADTL